MITRSKTASIQKDEIKKRQLDQNIQYLMKYIGTNKTRLNFILDYLKMRELFEERQKILELCAL